VQIRVFCRVRPGPASAVVCLPDGLSVRLEGQTEGIKDSSFAFDKVFGGQSSQAEVFAEVSDMVQSALDGYKVVAKPWAFLLNCKGFILLIFSGAVFYHTV
jgi:kinesin family protein C1